MNFVLLSIFLLFQQNIINGCPSVCSCRGFSVDCSNRNLQIIPSGIPKNVLKLEFQFNNLSFIRNDELKAFRQLRILRLNGNKLNHITDGTFATFKRLKRLDLSSNRLRTITKGMLQGLQEIKNLQLDHNEISCIESEAINELKGLKILTLNSNNLTTLPILPFAQLTNLRVLRLHDNQLICDCRLLWLTKYLQSHPRLSLNTQCQDGDTLNFKHLTSLIDDDDKRCANMDIDNIEYTCNVFICPYSCTCFNGVVDCKDKDLIEIPRNIPDTIIELRLEKNRITEIPSKIFNHLKNLRRLDLSNNLISTIYPNSFAGLKSLNSLILYRNNLKILPSGVFNQLRSLQLFILSNNQLVYLPFGIFDHELTHVQLLLLNANKILSIRKDTFYGLEKLNLLSLYDNQLKTLTNETFQPLKNIQTLHLARNPLVCNCHLRWLNAYLHQNPIETSGVRCAGPPYMAKRKIGVLNDRRFRCRTKQNIGGRDQQTVYCPKGCICHKTTVKCRGLQLLEIPNDIPTFTTVLDLQDNLIKRLFNLQRLKNLRILDLSNNRLEEIDNHVLNGIPLLNELNLQSNPLVCDCHLQWLKQSRFITHHAKCISPIKLHNISILDIPDEDFVCYSCPQNCTCYNHIIRCSHASLIRIPYEEIPMDTNELYFDSNKIEEISIELLNRFIYLIRIDLSYNKIHLLEENLFINLTRLETLILSYNKIQCLNINSFKGLKNLKILSLHGNEISTISEGSFNDLKFLSHIALGGNPFYCDCYLAWLSSWIKTDYIESGIARCTGPSQMANKLLLTSPISLFQCYNKSESNYYQEKCNSSNESYIKLSKPNIYPYLNITIIFRTKQNNGILIYFGYWGHIVAELFMGRIRVSYDRKNSPGSVIFSHEIVNDGKIHELQLISIRQNFSLIIDRNYTRFINNHDENTFMNTSEIDALYIGGLPKEMSVRALQLWHVREAISFRGCIHALYINNDRINFANTDYRYKIFSDCEINQTFIPSSSLDSCNIRIKTGYYIDPSTNCTSSRRLRMTKCSGICQSLLNNETLSSCCKPVEPKRRYFQMTCASGFIYRQSLDFFTQCKCLNTVC